MLSIQNVNFKYDNQPVFENVNLELGAGEFAFLIGKSGSGKTTLLQMIYMNTHPTSGNVIVGNFNSDTIKKTELPFLRRKIGIVFQDFKLLTDRNVFDNLSFVLEVTATNQKEIKKRVNDVLAEVGLTHKRLNYPDQPVSYTHLRAHETVLDLVCRLLLEKKNYNITPTNYKPHNTNNKNITITLLQMLI
mgnify:CR=1 FL=1